MWHQRHQVNILKKKTTVIILIYSRVPRFRIWLQDVASQRSLPRPESPPPQSRLILPWTMTRIHSRRPKGAGRRSKIRRPFFSDGGKRNEFSGLERSWKAALGVRRRKPRSRSPLWSRPNWTPRSSGASIILETSTLPTRLALASSLSMERSTIRPSLSPSTN